MSDQWTPVRGQVYELHLRGKAPPEHYCPLHVNPPRRIREHTEAQLSACAAVVLAGLRRAEAEVSLERFATAAGVSACRVAMKTINPTSAEKAAATRIPPPPRDAASIRKMESALAEPTFAERLAAKRTAVAARRGSERKPPRERLDPYKVTGSPAPPELAKYPYRVKDGGKRGD
jgi:hypothetical protein